MSAARPRLPACRARRLDPNLALRDLEAHASDVPFQRRRTIGNHWGRLAVSITLVLSPSPSGQLRRHAVGVACRPAPRVLLPDRSIGGGDAVRTNIGPRLAIGWTMGTVVSALGVWLSLQLDLPTGAAIVCTFGVVLILVAAVRSLFRRSGALAAPTHTGR
jgi:hypothetical protein